ncbi:hypothetical protein [Actinomadura oligospora]|uniref:hypothetical protein n=1 Tax=Actinomadura oligospora TaxID=111804 RepID=UPI0004AC5DD5|nr:hypothetical protein [Actinomadura oligospora]
MVMVVLVLAGVAVLAAVVVLAMGHGGELGRTHPDVPPMPLLDGARVTGPEVAMLRLPRALWGYQMNVTDEALHRLAYALTERDTRVAAMEQQIADLRRRLTDAEGPGSGPSEASGGWATPGEPPATATDIPTAAEPYEDGPDRPEGGSDRYRNGGDRFDGDEGPEAFGGGLFEGRRELLENEKPHQY